ncbi:MAG: substrate-binding domain-containing protein, partial [Spirochaetaceae bacterium]|nr:substrate-binding domain-containing protein [Spirochaetaceae bacterium]
MKKVKKIVAVTLMLAITAVSLYATGGQQKKDGINVGFIVGSRQHVFYTLIEKGIKEAAPANGINAIVMDGDLDGNVTSDHINNFVTEGVNAIALSANDPGGTTPAIRNAVTSKVPVFTFDCTIADASLITSFVGTDNVEGGRLGGRETVRLAAPGAKVGLINFDNPQSCLDRRAGWEEVVKASDKNLKIIE